jgi:hypothetical protein
LSAIVIDDLDAVLAKMLAGEFLMILVVKGEGAEPDDLVTYPTSGEPMTADATQTVLAGFLKQVPMPRTDDESKPPDDPKYDSNLKHLGAYLRDLVKGQSKRGQDMILAETSINPMPE